jgi:P-type Ca2+ transporter type 2C
VLLTVPGLRHAFNFGPMTPSEWLVALVAGFIGVTWFEVYQARARRRCRQTK